MSRQYNYRGCRIVRGDYVGTSDNRADGWYVDRDDETTMDRRGEGHRTINEAKIHIDECQDYGAE